MFVTFSALKSYTNEYVWWYSRIYFYTFIALFIYVVLSVFIAIIMEAYESIKVSLINLGLEKAKRQVRCPYHSNAMYMIVSGKFRNYVVQQWNITIIAAKDH